MQVSKKKDYNNIFLKRKSFIKRWDTSDFEDYDPNKIKVRCLAAIKNILNIASKPSDFSFGYDYDFLDDYCGEVSMILGIENKSNNFHQFELKDLYKYLSSLDLNNEKDFAIFIWYIEITFNYDFLDYIDKEELVHKVSEALELSNANVKILKTKKDYELYPKNTDFLDEPLVFDILSWLDKHKTSKTHFSNALKIERTESNYRNIVDELRFSLESFFQSLFSNKKTLENQKSNIGSYLKESNVSTNISNMYMKLIELYCSYNNDNAKHGDDIIKDEIDYLIYLTGSFIRFMIQIKESKIVEKDSI